MLSARENLGREVHSTLNTGRRMSRTGHDGSTETIGGRPVIGDAMSPSSDAPQSRRDSICVHIFTASATLVGVCLTVIGLLRVVQRLRDVSTLADELLSVNAIAFLAACVTAYVALRTDHPARRRRIERIADAAFLGALALMTAVCALLAVQFV